MAFFTRLVGRQEPAPLQLPTESTFYFDVQAQRWRTRGQEHLEEGFDLDAPLPEVKAVISPVPELAEKTEKTAVEELMTPPMVYTTEVLKRRGAQAAQVDKPSMDLDIESCATASPPNSPSLTEQSDAPTPPEVDFPETPVPRTPVIREPFGNQLEHQKLTGLLHMLNEQTSNIEVCAKVCSALEGFALRDPKNLFTIIESGCVEELFVALERFANEDPVAQVPIVELLWSLSFEEMAVDRVAERSKASLMSLAGIMQRHEVQGMARLQACVCGTLVNLAVRKQTCIEMVHCGLMEQICIALQQHADCPELQELGCQALYMVANHPELRAFVLAAGAVPAAKVGHEKWGSWLQEILLC